MKQIGEKEIVVLLRKRLLLTIARKNIVRNDQNTRWECNANN